jgi:hypothetical protein
MKHFLMRVSHEQMSLQAWGLSGRPLHVASVSSLALHGQAPMPSITRLTHRGGRVFRAPSMHVSGNFWQDRCTGLGMQLLHGPTGAQCHPQRRGAFGDRSSVQIRALSGPQQAKHKLVFLGTPEVCQLFLHSKLSISLRGSIFQAIAFN